MNCVLPVHYVSDGVSVQTTSRELTPLSIAVRSLALPHLGAHLTMALYFPSAAKPEVALGRVALVQSDAPGRSSFWADFVVVDPQARMRLVSLLSELKNNQRACARRAVQLQVRLRTRRELVQVQAANLSRGGIFIHCDEPPAVDTVLEVEVQLPDSGPPVTSGGVVVRRQLAESGQPPGVGVQFVNAGEAFRERIDRYMQELLKT